MECRSINILSQWFDTKVQTAIEAAQETASQEAEKGFHATTAAAFAGQQHVESVVVVHRIAFCHTVQCYVFGVVFELGQDNEGRSDIAGQGAHETIAGRPATGQDRNEPRRQQGLWPSPLPRGAGERRQHDKHPQQEHFATPHDKQSGQ